MKKSCLAAPTSIFRVRVYDVTQDAPNWRGHRSDFFI
jgi:hypothetical protein